MRWAARCDSRAVGGQIANYALWAGPTAFSCHLNVHSRRDNMVCWSRSRSLGRRPEWK